LHGTALSKIIEQISKKVLHTHGKERKEKAKRKYICSS
jgi:hypothetical protein